MFPDYSPVKQGQCRGVQNRDELIKMYFNACYTNTEILASLALLHGVSISLRHLKRILNKLKLRRKKTVTLTHVESVAEAVEIEINSSGATIGYRAMWKRLKLKYGLSVNRDVVLKLMNIIDPDGIERRKKHRLLRRKYKAAGPNFIWHIDGYDKLKPFGFAVHGAIDGYSRRIVWLEISSSNNDPGIIANYYLSCVKREGVVPRILRCDLGTENSRLEYLQPLFRWHDCDDLAGINSFMYGKSTSNQRIEAWWSMLRRQGADWWIKYYKDLIDRGVYHDYDPLHVDCMRYCYMGVMRDELNSIAMEWNLHYITSKANSDNVRGKPDVLYYLPELSGCRNYGTSIDLDIVDACTELYATQVPDYGSSPQFIQLANEVMPEHHIPTTVTEAETLFTELIRAVEIYI